MKQPSIVEKIITVIILLFYTGGPLTVIVSGGFNQGDTDSANYPYINEIFQGIYFLTVTLLVQRWKQAFALLMNDKLMLLLLGITLCSTFWSTASGITLVRVIALIGTTLFAIYLVTCYTLKQYLQSLGWMFGISIILSFTYIIFLPHFGLMGAIHSGTWRGIYTHKNVLGSMMSLSSICFLLLTFLNREKKWIPMSGMVLSIILLLGSRSSTPLLNLFIGISALFVSRIVRLPYQLKLSIIFLLASIGFISTAIGSDLGEIFTGVFGKDVTLSGRTEVWSYVWDMIYQRPWLGYGYGALWVDWNSESNYVWKAVNWEAPNAHNGFLEVWLGIGFIGLFVFLLHLLINLFRSLSMIQFLRSAESSFPFLLILLMLLASITESLLLTRNGIYWILYVSVTLYLSRNKEIKDFGSSRSPVITAESSVREENNFIFKDHV